MIKHDRTFRKVKIIFLMCKWKRQVEQSSRQSSGVFLELMSCQSQLRRTSQLILFKLTTMHIWHLVCGSWCSLERDGSGGGWQEEYVSVRKWKVHRRLGVALVTPTLYKLIQIVNQVSHCLVYHFKSNIWLLEITCTHSHAWIFAYFQVFDHCN